MSKPEKHVWIGMWLVISNFFFQWLGEANWSQAIERSWFQMSAVTCCWLASLVFSPDGEASK